MKCITVIFLSLVLIGCSSGRYSQKYDSAPVRPPTQLELKDAEVIHEPVGRGNNPYVVFGKKYVPMRKRKPFNQTGVASWYGKKFHGHLTSNGEVYNMYGMSAAHKTLPLPSYVRVTNLANNKSVVVRVNDRGPFHQDRIIDLSYSAAVKIGVYDTGTAKVKVETILPPPLIDQDFRIVVKGFTSEQEAKETAIGLGHMLHLEPSLIQANTANKLVLGPFDNKQTAEQYLEQLQGFGYPNAAISTAE